MTMICTKSRQCKNFNCYHKTQHTLDTTCNWECGGYWNDNWSTNGKCIAVINI